MGQTLQIKNMVLYKTALPSDTRATCTSDQLATDSEIPMDSFRLHNLLERQNSKKQYNYDYCFIIAKRTQIRRYAWG